MKLLKGALDTRRYRSELFGSTSVQNGRMHNPNDRSLGLVLLTLTLFLNGKYPRWSMPPGLMLAGVVPTLPIEVHKLPRLKHLSFPGMSTGCSEDTSPTVRFQKGLSSSARSKKRFFEGLVAVANTACW